MYVDYYFQLYLSDAVTLRLFQRSFPCEILPYTYLNIAEVTFLFTTSLTYDLDGHISLR